LEEAPREAEQATAEGLRCVSRRRVGPGLVRYTLDAPDSDAALIDGVLDGPLAAPDPARDDGAGDHGAGHEGQDDRDGRSVGQRRYDAVLTVISRGLAHPGAPP
ncbi:DUF222 domain-containing protein, partial [Ornithinimicrobium kibberense]